MSHAANVGVWAITTYVLPAAAVVVVAFALVGPKVRAVIASAVAALLWCYSLWVAAAIVLFSAPLATALSSLAVVVALAIVASLIAQRVYGRAFSKLN